MPHDRYNIQVATKSPVSTQMVKPSLLPHATVSAAVVKICWEGIGVAMPSYSRACLKLHSSSTGSSNGGKLELIIRVETGSVAC